jgi:hypothetical protein
VAVAASAMEKEHRLPLGPGEGCTWQNRGASIERVDGDSIHIVIRCGHATSLRCLQSFTPYHTRVCARVCDAQSGATIAPARRPCKERRREGSQACSATSLSILDKSTEEPTM